MQNWITPQRLDSMQRSLFMASVDEALAELKVSQDECQRWKNNGWLSFDVTREKVLEPPLEAELEFIAAIARAGLNDAMISKLLSSLERPYRYDPRGVAYSFRDGWVQCPSEDAPYDVIEENIDDWLDDLSDEEDHERLHQLQSKINAILGEPKVEVSE